MRFLNPQEGGQWARGVGWVDLTPDPDLQTDKFDFVYGYLAPEDSGRKTALSRLIISAVNEAAGEGVLWISGFGVWP